MNQITRVTLLLLAALILSHTAHARPNKAIIRSVRNGAAQVTTDGKTWKPARVGQQLGEHSAVKTDPNATVDLFLGDNGPAVRVTKDTTLAIDRLNIENTGIEKIIETQLDLRNGKILGHVKKMAAASKYEIKTPVGIIGIRGTDYEATATGIVRVYTGVAVVVYISGDQITVNAGTEVLPPSSDQLPRSEPITAPNPEIKTLMDGITQNPDGTWTLKPDPYTRRTVHTPVVIHPPDEPWFGNFDITNLQSSPVRFPDECLECYWENPDDSGL